MRVLWPVEPKDKTGGNGNMAHENRIKRASQDGISRRDWMHRNEDIRCNERGLRNVTLRDGKALKVN